ncbi:hypothetical protein CHS0354_031915 [Potamilus streckersoni]|uniref:Uncharacterized protein n=1 Tax=Potamilus streckersoni TaxID=2493646 RepID=A0AAE0VLS6_9BIVA|nr:hypothetical protein CHS0354_031915 [Potamilus streckersoni]
MKMRVRGDNVSIILKLYSSFTFWTCVILFLVIIWSPSSYQVRRINAKHIVDPIADIQVTCKNEDESLNQAESRNDSSSVCRSFHDFVQCVGKNVPECFEKVAVQYHIFTLPPWNCVITQEQIIQYQELATKGCGQEVAKGTDSTTGETFPGESNNKTGHESHQGPNTKESTSNTNAYSPSPVGLIWIPWIVCLWTIRLLPS